jgi:hypothetical protein
MEDGDKSDIQKNQQIPVVSLLFRKTLGSWRACCLEFKGRAQSMSSILNLMAVCGIPQCCHVVSDIFWDIVK